MAAKDTARRERLERDAAELRTWLAAHPEDRRGPSGGVRQSNRTDHESAKLATGKGVIQGYTGVAVVDAAHQIVVDAQAHGTGAEQELLVPIVTALRPTLAPTTVLTADAGYHSEANLRDLAERGIDALIADNPMRQRDERLATQDVHRDIPHPMRQLTGESGDRGCSNQRLHVRRGGAHVRLCGGQGALPRRPRPRHPGLRRRPLPRREAATAVPARSARRVCAPPRRRGRARSPSSAGKAAGTPERHTDRMKRRLDTPAGRVQYGRRFATVEPVFGNLRANKRLDRFTLRGRTKVDGQWKLYCLVHNIEKLAHHGYAAPVAA